MKVFQKFNLRIHVADQSSKTIVYRSLKNLVNDDFVYDLYALSELITSSVSGISLNVYQKLSISVHH